MAKAKKTNPIVGGVDIHKGLHIAAVVDENDQVRETQSFDTRRQGYKLMLTWMRLDLPGYRNIEEVYRIAQIAGTSVSRTA